MDRRTFLSGSTMAAAAPLLGTAAIAGATDAPRTAERMQRLSSVMAESRMPIEFDGTAFSGTGYDWLFRRGSEAIAFLVGEEHGIAENPKLAGQLFSALVPKDYRHVAVEISPPMASALGSALSSRDLDAFDRLLTTPESRVAFFGMREEADWLRRARSALPGKQPFLWGLDYEVGADRYLIRHLTNQRKPAAAADPLARLEAASTASWARYEQTKNPQFIYSFAGDPTLVQTLAQSWPAAGANERLIMETLEQTFAINALWAAKRGYESNLWRSRFMRANLRRYWKEKQRTDPSGKLFMKMGASHLVRGLNMTDTFDLGSLMPELVEQAGGSAFHLMVLPGPGTQTANLDPTQFRYVAGNRDQYGKGMELFDEAIIPGTFTLFDTAPLRPVASSFSEEIPLPLWRVIHGFDAVLIMTGSHPSSNLRA